MHLRTLTFLITILSSGLSTSGQVYTPEQPDPLLQPWRWQAYPQLHGPGFRDVVEDANGHIWFGTDSGVKR
jgi:hypothetical protein